MPASSMLGFTLVELMVVMFIVGLIVLSAAPYLRQGIKAAESNSAARDFYTDLSYARSLAIKTGFPHLVQLCTRTEATGGGFNAVPGYMVFECSTASGSPPVTVGDFNAVQCNKTEAEVCTELANDSSASTTDFPQVRREVNLLKTGHSAQENANVAIKQIAGIAFGVAGSGVVASAEAPSNPTVPGDGIDLGCATRTSARRFLFLKNGQAVDDTGSHSPCSGTFYITSNIELQTFGANGDPTLNRALSFSPAGLVKVERWDTNGTGANRWR